jgi:hypothetical protein
MGLKGKGIILDTSRPDSHGVKPINIVCVSHFDGMFNGLEFAHND